MKNPRFSLYALHAAQSIEPPRAPQRSICKKANAPLTVKVEDIIFCIKASRIAYKTVIEERNTILLLSFSRSCLVRVLFILKNHSFQLGRIKPKLSTYLFILQCKRKKVNIFKQFFKFLVLKVKLSYL